MERRLNYKYGNESITCIVYYDLYVQKINGCLDFAILL